MSRGEMFLLDEISLADDAVLERLNSLLEPERRLNLAERSEGAGSIGVLETNDLTAHIGFRLVATMNPGGDYVVVRAAEAWIADVGQRKQ
ncbi:hypothetical protein X801_04117 [Opisthorchis viverrini]|uniref:ATPase dynein-related AAA domain-containing protein n=1 Tax=Opisthorchis viverrini TaxID=6198 RepID=A0A1S8WZX5_OPIVI|nr:hypothetical protein X801_04117 [Opisthorchis viverrini]